MVLLKRESVVTDALRYCDDVGAGLLAMGSQALASPGTMTGSVALSMTREATRPLLIVKVGAWASGAGCRTFGMDTGRTCDVHRGSMLRVVRC